MVKRNLSGRTPMEMHPLLRNHVTDRDGKVSSVLGASRDITERVHMQNALQESEEKYRAIVENSPNLTGIFQDGALRYVNSTAILKLGWTYEELVSPSFDAIEKVVSQKSRSLLKENMGKRLRGEDIAPYEISLTRKDGSEIQVLVRAAKIIYNQKPAIEFVFDDITERKRMEEELSRSSQFLGSVIENAYVWLNVLDTQQNVLVWNKAAETMSGYSREDVLGQDKIWERLYPDQEYRKQTIETVNDLLQSGRTDINTETRIKRKDGQTRIMSWNERPLTDQGGKAVGTIAIGHDITERKKMEERLRQSEERYHSLFQSMMEGFAYCKMIFDENGRPVDFVYIDVNSAFRPLTGLEDVVGKKVSEVIPGIKETNPEMFEIYGRVASTGKSEKFEVDVKPLGIRLNISVSSPAKGYFVAVFENITERKIAEERLRESEERFRSLFGRMLDGVYLSTHAGRFVDINPAFVEMFGYSSKQEMLDITDIKKELYFSPEERGRHILDADQEEVKEYRMRRKDGSAVWVEDHGGYVHDEQGNIIYHEGMLRDITERKQAEEALRDSEEKYRTIFHDSPLGIFRSTFDGHLLEANPALAKMFGYDSPENMIREVYDVAKQMYVRAEDRSRIITQQLGSNDTTQHLNHYRRKDSSEFIANLYLKTVRDSKRRPIFLEGIVEDITERKRLEDELERYSLHLKELVAERTAELRASEEKYRELFEACPVSLWEEDFSAVKQFLDELRQKGVSDLDAYFTNNPQDVAKCAGLVKVLNMNKATLDFYDAQSVDEIIGGLSGVLTEESNRAFVGEVLALVQGKKYYEAEFENKTLRGETKHCNVICAVVPGYEQSLAKVLISIVDLTPQKKLEEELRATKERLEYVIASNPAVLVLEKPLPDLSNTYSMFVSESATSVLGFEPKNFLGERGAEFFNSRVPPGDLARYLAEVPSLWRDGHHTFEFRFLHSDGAYRWIREEMKVTRDAEGRILNVVGVCTDATERKKLEEKLAKAERLAAIGETAAMVGHDLRNPLQGIAGALHLLKQESLTAEERAEMLQVIETSVHYSDAIVRDLSDYSAEIKLKPVETTLKSSIRCAIHAVKVPQNVTVRDLSEDQPTLRVDPDRMKRVFINLIENAIDAMPQGGTLTIISRKFDGNVEITLTDTGSGMSEKVMENLWKPLQTTKAKGLGLGLAICKRIIDAHGGTISVKSKVGEGTTMTIRLPIKLEAVEVTQK